MQRIEFRAMGCQMVAMIDAPQKNALLDCVPAWFAEWEQSLSRFRADSELNQINQNSGEPVRVSDTLIQVIHVALETARASNGLVTPTLLAALESAGYDRTFESLAPNPRSPMSGWSLVGNWSAIQCDESTRTVCLPVGMRVDLGGIAKGWAADQAAQRLGAHAPTLIDAGGDIAISAPPIDGERWIISVANPFDSDQPLEYLAIECGAVATSGRDYRRWQKNGVWQHHIIDPRTGQPVETDVVSATVIAPSTVQAEMAAKVLFILGWRAGLEWLEAQKDLAGLVLLENGLVAHSRRLEDFLRS